MYETKDVNDKLDRYRRKVGGRVKCVGTLVHWASHRFVEELLGKTE